MSTLLLNNYELLLTSKYADKIPIKVYRSRRTGLHVAMAESPTPVVTCNIVVPTEIKSQDGLPHTLEHLVFMGCNSFPLKGTLDLLSLKAMAIGGTNAFTEQDHTRYDVKTIGQSGMREFVRIYADHLINPMLTPQNYATEVYHVNADGEEAGVVYSEIQGYEQDLDSLVEKKVAELAFPSHPAFCVESGGRAREVRELCTLQRVQDYHAQFYHLRNMWISLCGTFDQLEMLKSIDMLDSRLENQPPTTFVRPFVNSVVPDIQRHRSEVEVVRVPSENEDEAVVQIGFLGRSAKDIEFLYAVEVIGSYLTQTTSAPLQREMVLIDDPYCDSVFVETSEFPRTLISVQFTGVPLDRVESVGDKFFEVLHKYTAPEVLDLNRIHYIVKQNVKKVYSGLETDVSEVIFYGLIGHQLFSNSLDDQEQFDRTMNPLPIYRQLLEKPVNYWAELIAELFTENCVVVIGRPDPKLAEKMEIEEAKRLEELKQSVEAGAIKRVKLDEDDEKADLSSINRFNEIEPEQKIDAFQVVTTVLTCEQNEDCDERAELLSAFPFTTILHDADSHFIRAYFVFDLKNIRHDLRKYSMLLTELIFKSSAVVNGRKLSDMEVADLMTKELMSQSMGLGFMSSYLHLLVFYLEVTADEFDLLSKWSRALLCDSEFEKAKVLSIAKNLACGASAKKREVDAMATILMVQMNNKPDHENSFYDDFILQNFHRDVAKRIEAGGRRAQQVMDELNEFRDQILAQPFNLHLICNPRELKAAEGTSNDWSFLKPKKSSEKLTISRSVDVQPFKCWTPSARIIKVDGNDASHIFCRSKIELEFGSPEHVAILTLTSYISMIEGELWAKVRGKGYSYAPDLSYSSVSDSLTLELDRCSRPVLAYETSRELVLELLDENSSLDPLKFDLAKRNAICTLLSRYETLKSTANYSVFDSLRGLSRDHINRLTQSIWAAEAEMIRQLARPHFFRLFDEDHSLIAVACPRNKLDEIKSRFPNIKTMQLSDLQLPR